MTSCLFNRSTCHCLATRLGYTKVNQDEYKLVVQYKYSEIEEDTKNGILLS